MSFKGLSGNSPFLIRKLGEATSEISTSLQRLSSGLRINNASDDAAGLAMAMSLRTDARVLGQGLRNVNDGISLLNVASVALDELVTISTRISELAQRAGNGTVSHSQRKALNAEASALSLEYSRIVDTTEFNGIKLLNGTSNQLSIHAGGSASDLIAMDFNVTTEIHGDGTFTAGAIVATGSGVGIHREVEIADLNDDGVSDLLFVDDNSGLLTIMLGNGNGTYKARTSLSAGLRTYDVQAVDVNNDGILDVVSSSYNGGGPGYLKTFLGNGDGTFGSGITSSTLNYNWFFTPGDVNGDGLMDMIVSEAYSPDTAVLIGDGAGNFTKTNTFSDGTAGTNYQHILGDLNSDGILDVVISGTGFTAFLGNGDGTFKRVSPSVDPLGLNLIGAGDFNGDGLVDVATISAANVMHIRLSNGDGTFKVASSINVGMALWQIQASDLNGDGKDDLVLSLGGTTAKAQVLLSNGDGTFAPGVTVGSIASGVAFPHSAECYRR